MSGYLEVKYPFKSSLGLNPFKPWKRQWCILRPSPTSLGGSMAVYCSEAGAAAGTIALPSGGVVQRAKSRSRPYAFAVYTSDDRKPRILFAAQSLHEAQSWMDKIRGLLNDRLSGTATLLKDSFSVTVASTELSRKCGLSSVDSILTLSPSGLLISYSQKLGTLIEWKNVAGVQLTENLERSKVCVLTINSDFRLGGELRFSTPQACELVNALKQAQSDIMPQGRVHSKSEGDLHSNDFDLGEVRRSSWYSSGPSDVSLDDIDLVMSKEPKCIPSGQLSRCNGEGDLAPSSNAAPLLNVAPIVNTKPAMNTASMPTAAHSRPKIHVSSFDDSMSDRRSLLSVASGIYEEIPDLPDLSDFADQQASTDTYCPMGRGLDFTDGVKTRARMEEPTYESVSECVYATMRRSKRFPPPPLPPRLPGPLSRKACGGSCGEPNPGPFGSLSADLPRCATLPAPKGKHFSVFRKRLKSDSRLATSPKDSKEKDVETKKKKFDFAPTRDIFKNFKVSRKMKNLKISSTLTKGGTKSCEFLDETEHVTSNRCSKSVECLENQFDDFNGDLSIDFNDDSVSALAFPQEIVDLILRGRQEIKDLCLKPEIECEYMPMSPIIPPPAPIEHHYMVMSPKTNIA